VVERLVGEHILHLGVQLVGKAVDFLRVAGVGGAFAVGEIPAQHIVNHRRPRTLFPATRSMPLTTSRDRVREVFIFVFILPLYYLWPSRQRRMAAAIGALWALSYFYWRRLQATPASA
jgi:hypothetical protein